MCSSYSVGQSVVNIKQPKGLIKLGKAAAAALPLKNVVSTAARNLLTTGMLSALRPHMSPSLAVGIASAVPGLALRGRSAHSAALIVKAASQAGAGTLFYSAEYSLWLTMKNRLTHKFDLKAGSPQQLAASFFAGCCATAACTIAMSAISSSCLPASVGKLCMKKVANKSLASGCGLMAMDKTFQTIYLPARLQTALENTSLHKQGPALTSIESPKVELQHTFEDQMKNPLTLALQLSHSSSSKRQSRQQQRTSHDFYEPRPRRNSLANGKHLFDNKFDGGSTPLRLKAT